MSRSVSEYLMLKSRESEDVDLGQSWAQLDELHAKKWVTITCDDVTISHQIMAPVD